MRRWLEHLPGRRREQPPVSVLTERNRQLLDRALELNGEIRDVVRDVRAGDPVDMRHVAALQKRLRALPEHLRFGMPADSPIGRAASDQRGAVIVLDPGSPNGASWN
jgi:hypothetical protein